jgi:hypothetical protein
MCLGLLVCSPASAVTIPVGSVINLTASISVPTTHDYLMFFGSPSTVGITGLGTGGSLPVLTNFTFPTVVVPADFSTGFVTAIGIVNDANVNDPNLAHVVVALGAGVPNVAGNPWLFSTAESTIATALQTGNTAALLAFFNANTADWISYSNGALSSGNMWEFSNGVSIGTLGVAVTAVPEPSTGFLMSLSLGGFALLAGIQRRAFAKA